MSLINTFKTKAFFILIIIQKTLEGFWFVAEGDAVYKLGKHGDRRVSWLLGQCTEAGGRGIMPTLSSLSPSPFLLGVRHDSMGWYHPHLGWIFSPRLNLSGNIITDTPRGVSPRWFSIQSNCSWRFTITVEIRESGIKKDQLFSSPTHSLVIRHWSLFLLLHH